VLARDEESFVKLIEHVSENVVAKYDRVSQKIIHEFVLSRGIGYWTTAADQGESVSLNPAHRPGTG
jgi:hypothetical protein